MVALLTTGIAQRAIGQEKQQPTALTRIVLGYRFLWSEALTLQFVFANNKCERSTEFMAMPESRQISIESARKFHAAISVPIAPLHAGKDLSRQMRMVYPS
jgi:hypothetical protein